MDENQPAFLDLMAFARGAEAANKANWNDVINDINTRTNEETLRQKQTEFDLGLPAAQLKAEDATGTGIAARNVADFQASLTQKLAMVPREQQSQVIADALSARLAGLQPNSPGAAKEQEALRQYATRQAAELARTGDISGAQAILAKLPGAGYDQQLGEIAKWRNPQTALDPVNITAAGGVIDPTSGMVNYMGAKMTQPQFAQLMGTRAANALANPMGGLQDLTAQNQQAQWMQSVAALYNQQGLGTSMQVNPITGQYMVVPLRADGTPAGPGVPVPGASASTATAPTAGGAGTAPAVNQGGVPSNLTPQQMEAYVSSNTAPVAPAADTISDPYQALVAGSVNQAPQAGGGSWIRDSRGNLQLLQPFYRLGEMMRGAPEQTWWSSLTPQQQQQLIANQQLVNPAAPNMSIPMNYNAAPSFFSTPGGAPAPVAPVQGTPLPVVNPVTIPMPAAPSNVVPGAPGNWLTNLPR